MKWSPGCGCCGGGGCFTNCPTPLGLDVVWSTATVSGCSCSGRLSNNLRQANSNLWFAPTLCRAQWETGWICCSETSPGVYSFSAFVLEASITKGIGWFNLDIVTISGHHSATITDTGSGTGDPCTKNWLLFITTSNQTIDGWTMSGVNYLQKSRPYSASQAEPNCYTSGTHTLTPGTDVDNTGGSGENICALPTNIDLVIP